MKGQVLKILFKKDLAFLTEEIALDFNQVQLPDPDVKFKASAYWTIKVISYREDENRLFVDVLSYHVGDTQFSNDQIELSDILITIEKVTFKNINTFALLDTLNYTEPIKITAPKPEKVYRREIPIQHEPIKKNLTEIFSVLIKNITFDSGRVVFTKKLSTFYTPNPIEFQILNAHVIKEFDAVKNYFAKVLETKKILVEVNIEVIDGNITNKSATSIEIEKIDNGIIEQLNFEIVKTARKKELTGDKQLYTMDEYLEAIVRNDIKAKTFFRDEVHFFDNLLKNSNSKHYNNLRYLSSKHSHDNLKLRFVHNPFAFVFLLCGMDKFYIVWETLDTQEATYIWSCQKDNQVLKQMLSNVDSIIKLIKSDGKHEYINQKEENFNRVYHDYTDLENGFKNWKSEIEKIIKKEQS